MMQQQLDIIGLRVTEMVERIRLLRSEKMRLQAKIDEQERDCQRLQEERSLVRERVEKILEKLSRTEGSNGVK